jgi:hypothetical protein
MKKLGFEEIPMESKPTSATLPTLFSVRDHDVETLHMRDDDEIDTAKKPKNEHMIDLRTISSRRKGHQYDEYGAIQDDQNILDSSDHGFDVGDGPGGQMGIFEKFRRGHITGKDLVKNCCNSMKKYRNGSLFFYTFQFFGTLLFVVLFALHFFSINQEPNAGVLQAFIMNSVGQPLTNLEVRQQEGCLIGEFNFLIGCNLTPNLHITTWKNHVLCSHFNLNVTRGQSCGAGFIDCHAGWCYSETTGCPVTNILAPNSSESGSDQFSVENSRKEVPIYNISTSFGNLPCFDSTISLNSKTQDCGTFGVHPSAFIIDTQDSNGFAGEHTLRQSATINTDTVSLVGITFFDITANEFCLKFDKTMQTYGNLFDLDEGMKTTYGFLILCLGVLAMTFILAIILNLYHYKRPLTTKFFLFENETFYFYPGLQVVALAGLSLTAAIYYYTYNKHANYFEQALNQRCYTQHEVALALRTLMHTIKSYAVGILKYLVLIISVNIITMSYFCYANRKTICSTEGHVELEEKDIGVDDEIDSE